MNPRDEDTRYPYTYADDYIRILAGYGVGGTTISRSDALKIIEGISVAMGIDIREITERLADYYKAHEDDLNARSAKEFLAWHQASRG
jgi:transposase